MSVSYSKKMQEKNAECLKSSIYRLIKQFYVFSSLEIVFFLYKFIAFCTNILKLNLKSSFSQYSAQVERSVADLTCWRWRPAARGRCLPRRGRCRRSRRARLLGGDSPGLGGDWCRFRTQHSYKSLISTFQAFHIHIRRHSCSRPRPVTKSS